MIWSEKLKRQRIKMWNLKIQTHRPVEQNSSWRMGTCLAICGPMACSMPGFPVLHYLPEFTQTHVHWISDAIQPSHSLSSPSPSAFNLSKHQDLFQWVGSLHQMAKVLEFQLQHQSFQWIFTTDCLEDWLAGSPCSPRDSRVFSNTTVQEHQFSVLSFLHSPILTSIHDHWKNHSLD